LCVIALIDAVDFTASRNASDHAPDKVWASCRARVVSDVVADISPESL
jgi:hypothetical protein